MPSPQVLRRGGGTIGRSLGSMRTWQSNRSPYETPGILIKNNSGGSLLDGDVVVVDPLDERSITTTTTAGEAKPLVVMTGAEIGESVRCYPVGCVAIVACTGVAVSPGDLMITSAVAGVAKVLETEIPLGIFGIALTETTGVGVEETAVLLISDLRRTAAFVQLLEPAMTWSGQLWVDMS